MARLESSDIQLIAPALLQLNRGEKTSPYESCPSPACGAPITTFPDCPECRNTTNLNLQCDSCYTACASPCNDDDCDIPQPCYDEHCAVESCVDGTCATDSCTDGTCPETVHCNATCFDTDCLYSFGDDDGLYNSEKCGQGPCFGFLPVGPGLDGSPSNHDMLYQCPQTVTTESTSMWDSFGMQDQSYLHDHINQSNRHKRRRIQTDGYAIPGAQDWSHDHFDGMFSQEAFDQALDHALPSDNAISSYAEFDGQCTTHLHLKHHPQHDWTIMTDSLSCHPATEKCSHPNAEPRKHKRVSIKTAKLMPVPSLTEGCTNLAQSFSTSPHIDHFDTELNLTCQWVTNSSSGAVCGHRFSCARDLDEHLQKAHTSKLGSQAFVCCWQGCNTAFKHRGKLNRHISGAHSKYHAHICTHIDPATSEPCARTFCTKEQLKNHETTHTGERKYKCRYCDHTSATKTQHNTHERIHTKEKPYQCTWCGHRSGDSSNLSKHVRNKHPGMAGKAKKSASVEALGFLSA